MADSSGGGNKLFARLGCAIASIRGPPKTELEALLDSITRASDSIDVNQVALDALIRCCADEAERRTIMRLLHSCLAEAESSQWRCVYLALQVLEQLFNRAPPELVTEAASGAHFDVNQRLSFLEKYEMGIDVRVQNLIRRKASTIKADWLRRQNEEETGEDAPKAPQPGKMKSPGAKSSKSYKTAVSRLSADTDDSGDDRGKQRLSSDPRVSARRMQASDSTDDEEGHDKKSASSKKFGGGYSSDPRVQGMLRRPGDDSTDDEEDNGRRGRAPKPAAAAAKPPPPPAPAPSAGVDLMGLLDEPVAPAPAATRAAAPADSVDLLGGAASSSDRRYPEPGEPDWLAMAQTHGLYSTGQPGAGEPPSVAQPASKEASLLDF